MKIEDKGCYFYLAFIAIINDIILKDRNANKKEGGHIRKERIWYPGATYHAMARGIRRMEIFQDDTDYQVFLILLKKMMEKHACYVHAYCLMTNHFHLLIETGEEEIGKTVKGITSCYAAYYNQKYGYHGHVFEGRFKSCLVKDDSYFLQTSRYIHMNPVKARITEHPEDYPWSSYRTMLRIADDRITEREKTLSYFKQSIFYYREFVEDLTHKYIVSENNIQKEIGEDETWLPW